MEQILSKRCTKVHNYLFNYRYFKRARDGFGALLDLLGFRPGDKILVPGYIGWSPREGSGVFDPIREHELVPVFYHFDNHLKIQGKDIIEKIIKSQSKVFLIIHYFGFPDVKAQEYIELARDNGLIIIEDAAHGMYTDMISNGCGKWGDYTLFSLHKMLPMEEGGLLRANEGIILPDSNYMPEISPFNYNFQKISEIRRNNYLILDRFIRDVPEGVSPLFDLLPDEVVPQTYPIVLPISNRDKIYEYMNERGWGVVSLYHTLIKEIAGETFKEEKKLSQMIMNLPVHQDVNPKLYVDMVNDLDKAIEIFKYRYDQ